VLVVLMLVLVLVLVLDGGRVGAVNRRCVSQR
jgi:hypothetical protein